MAFLKKLIFFAVVIYIICLIFNANATPFSQQEAASNIKSILSQATQVSIKQLGESGEFSTNSDINIGLPDNLSEPSKLLERIGLGNQFLPKVKTLTDRNALASHYNSSV